MDCTIYLLDNKQTSKQCKQFLRTLTHNNGKIYSEGLPELCSQLLNDRGEGRTESVLIIFVETLEEYLKGDRDKALADVLALGATLVICGDSEQDCTLTNQFCSQVSNLKFSDTALTNLTYRNIDGLYHPKEAFVESRLHPDINGTLQFKSKHHMNGAGGKEYTQYDKLPLIFPFSQTIEATNPDQIILQSNDLCFPAHRCLLSYTPAGKGSVVLCASSRILHDRYINFKENRRLIGRLFGFLKTPTAMRIGPSRGWSEVGEIVKPTQIPHIQGISKCLRACLEVPEALPADFAKLFNTSLYKFDVDLVQEVVDMHEELNVEHQTLNLIPPKFEMAYYPLEPAVFPPNMMYLKPPPLELFDLDQEFASKKCRLAQLANKCSDKEDLAYFLETCSNILRMPIETYDNQSADHRGKAILHHMLTTISKYKMSRQV